MTATVRAIEAPPIPPLRRDCMVRTWLAASTLSAAGDALFTVALAWTAVHRFSPALAGAIVGAETVPQALITLGGGVLADRLDTRRVLIAGEIGRIAVLLCAAAAWSMTRSAGVLVAVAVCFGLIAGVSNPARGTLARQLVRDPDLIVLSGWAQVGSRLAVLGGAPVGAVVVGTAGLAPAMLLDVASFGATLAALVFVIRPRRVLRASRGQERWSASLRELRCYLRDHADARVLTIGICALNVFVTPVTALGVALRVSSAHWSAAWVGAAQACLAAGAIAGSAAAIANRRGRVAVRAYRALVVQGVALAAVGVDSRVTLLAAMTLVGVTAGLASVWLSGVFQRTIAGTHLGRVTSVSQLGDQTIVPLMLPLFGVVAAGAGVLGATVACGSGMALLCLALALHPAVRALQ